MLSPPSQPPPATSAPGSPFFEEALYKGAGERGELREVLDVVARGRWLILGIVLVVAAPAALWVWTQPARYSSYVLLMVEKQDDDLVGVLPTAGAGFRPERNLANEILVLQQSMPLALRAAERLQGYEQVPGSSRPPSVLAPVATARGERPPTTQEVAFRLQGGHVVVAQEGLDTDALRVSAVSTDPAEAALLANVYAEAFVDLSQESSRSGVHASRTFLEGQVAEHRTELQSLDEEVRSFMLREQAVALDDETTRLVSQIASLEARRDAAAVDAQMRSATIASIEGELRELQPRLADAVASGAVALFGEKYDDDVRVLTLGEALDGSGKPYSIELCGGTHVRRLGDIALFKIVGESAVSAGVRGLSSVTLMIRPPRR